MQEVSDLYNEIYESQDFYVETSLAVGDRGYLLTEKAERILFGGYAILIGDGGPETGYGEEMLLSIKTTKRVFKSNVPEVGCCPCGEIYVEMHMPKGTIERKAAIVPYVRLVSNIDGRRSEWIKKGIFFTDTRDNSHNDDDLDILTLHGYDAMMKAEVLYGEYFSEESFCIYDINPVNASSDWTKTNGKYVAKYYSASISSDKEVEIEYTDDDSIAFEPYLTVTQKEGYIEFETTVSPPTTLAGKLIIHNANTLGFPAVDIDVVNDIASKMEVTVDSRSIPYIDRGYMIEYPAEYTMRETLGYIGAMYGGNWIMNDVGELQFIPLWDLPPETSLLTTDLGYRIVFGDTRIKLFKYD